MLSRTGRVRRVAAGSTLLVVVAMIAIVIAAAATIVPGLVGVIEFERVDRAARTLAAYESALARFSIDLSARPGTIAQLTRQIVASDLNSCGQTYGNRDLKDDGTVWKGPYVTRVVPAHGGLPLELGVLENQLVRDPVVALNQNAPGELMMQVTGVDLIEARALDVRVDGAADRAAGKVQWGAADAEGFVTVEFMMTVTGC